MTDRYSDIIDWPKIVYENQISDYMTQYISGQSEIIDLLSFIGHLYTLKLYGLQHHIRLKSMPRVNALVTGPTGYGKSFSIRKFAESMEMVYYRIDCSTCSAEGWHGTNLSQLIKEFLKKSPYGFGILHLDEIDKLGHTGSKGHESATASKLQLQMALLDLLDGDYGFLQSDDMSNKTTQLNNVNNALVIMSGSFQSERNFEESESKRRPIGFSSSFDKPESNMKTWREKLKNLGFIQELAGRILCTIELEKYNSEQIKSIVKDTKDSSYIKYLNLFGGKYSLTDTEIDDMVDRVKDSDFGLRELESIMFETVYNKRRKK